MTVCPACRQHAARLYPIDGPRGTLDVCGFCYGIGPDGTRSAPISRELAEHLGPTDASRDER